MTAPNDPWVLVTGAAKRLGATIAEHFHSAGYRVVIHYNRSAAAADRLCERLNRQRDNSAISVQADLCQAQGIEHIAQCIQSLGQLDVLINNASGFYPTPLHSACQQQWQELMGSNAQAPFWLAVKLRKLLRSSAGSIVNISDIHAMAGLKDYTIYTMAKAANIAMTKSLARELAPHTRVNSIAPGAILWPESGQPEDAQQRLQNIPMARLGRASEIAATALFLARDAHYITGQVIAVDGGASHCL